MRIFEFSKNFPRIFQEFSKNISKYSQFSNNFLRIFQQFPTKKFSEFRQKKEIFDEFKKTILKSEILSHSNKYTLTTRTLKISRPINNTPMTTWCLFRKMTKKKKKFFCFFFVNQTLKKFFFFYVC